MTYTLLSDSFQVQTGKNGKVKNGSKGDKVELVSDRGEILIVTNGKTKFSVNKESVKEG